VNVGSLFTGIGGLDLGLARAGLRHEFLCESDPWRRSILRRRFPGVRTYEDVRKVATSSSQGRLRALGGGGGLADAGRARPRGEDGDARLGLLAGGFPCTDVSVAGRRGGLAGAGSGLFFEFARVAEALRPRWLLVENVPGLLSSNGGRDFGVVLGTLADLGYGLAWRTLDSRYFGVPQRRRRLFVVGAEALEHPRAGAERAAAVLALGESCRRHPPKIVPEGQGAPYVLTDGTGSALSRPLGSLTGGFRTTDLDGSPALVGNIDVENPLLAYSIVPEGGQGADLQATEIDTAPALISEEHRKTDRGVRILDGLNLRRLTPTECERLQALPDGWTSGGSDTARYAAVGDAVTVTVAEWIGRRLVAAG
jgi:DNA (cytosine-5)-methyltransferase 1